METGNAPVVEARLSMAINRDAADSEGQLDDVSKSVAEKSEISTTEG